MKTFIAAVTSLRFTRTPKNPGIPAICFEEGNSPATSNIVSWAVVTHPVNLRRRLDRGLDGSADHGSHGNFTDRSHLLCISYLRVYVEVHHWLSGANKRGNGGALVALRLRDSAVMAVCRWKISATDKGHLSRGDRIDRLDHSNGCIDAPDGFAFLL